MQYRHRDQRQHPGTAVNLDAGLAHRRGALSGPEFPRNARQSGPAARPPVQLSCPHPPDWKSWEEHASARFYGPREKLRMRILVVEDEPLLAMLTEECLTELGHEIVGSAATVDQALATIDTTPLDFALLDFTLADEATSAPVAVRLQADGVPFVYLTGHRSLPLGGEVPVAPLLTKPFTIDQLDKALRTRLAA
jgi:CheY-like chemotaxis protein